MKSDAHNETVEVENSTFAIRSAGTQTFAQARTGAIAQATGLLAHDSFREVIYGT
jgi:hypothetical protein